MRSKRQLISAILGFALLLTPVTALARGHRGHAFRAARTFAVHHPVRAMRVAHARGFARARRANRFYRSGGYGPAPAAPYQSYGYNYAPEPTMPMRHQYVAENYDDDDDAPPPAQGYCNLPNSQAYGSGYAPAPYSAVPYTGYTGSSALNYRNAILAAKQRAQAAYANARARGNRRGMKIALDRLHQLNAELVKADSRLGRRARFQSSMLGAPLNGYGPGAAYPAYNGAGGYSPYSQYGYNSAAATTLAPLIQRFIP
jgi:hypothetical protein